MDLHRTDTGVFNIPVDNLFATPVLSKYVEGNFTDENSGGFLRMPEGWRKTRAFAKRLQAGLAIVDKKRQKPNVSPRDEHNNRRSRARQRFSLTT